MPSHEKETSSPAKLWWPQTSQEGEHEKEQYIEEQIATALWQVEREANVTMTLTSKRMGEAFPPIRLVYARSTSATNRSDASRFAGEVLLKSFDKEVARGS